MSAISGVKTLYLNSLFYLIPGVLIVSSIFCKEKTLKMMLLISMKATEMSVFEWGFQLTVLTQEIGEIEKTFDYRAYTN